jgi:hypothetical protein
MSKDAAVTRKSLYTARFFETPSSSESTHPPSSKPQPSAYLEGLFQTHVALNQMSEIPDSSAEKVDPERVEALRKQVVDAFNAAKNPASGKWGLLANLLQTGTAKGKYKYVGTTADALPPEPGPDGWLLADTEEEWLEWEEKRKEERRLAGIEEQKRRNADQKLKDKIETWKRSVDPIPESDIHPILDNRLSNESHGVEPKPHNRTGSLSRTAKSSKVSVDGTKPKSTASAPRTLKARPRSIAELPEVLVFSKTPS